MKISFKRKENKKDENKKDEYKNSLIYLNEEDMIDRLGDKIDNKFEKFTDLFIRGLFREEKFTPFLLKAEEKVLSLNDAQKILYFLIKQKKIAKELRILSPIINYDLYNKKLAEFNDPEISCIFIKIFGGLHNDDMRLYPLFEEHLDIVYNSKSLELNAFVLSVLGDQIASRNKHMIIDSKDIKWNYYLADRAAVYFPPYIDYKPHAQVILNSTEPFANKYKKSVQKIIEEKKTLSQLIKEI